MSSIELEHQRGFKWSSLALLKAVAMLRAIVPSDLEIVSVKPLLKRNGTHNVGYVTTAGGN